MAQTELAQERTFSSPSGEPETIPLDRCPLRRAVSAIGGRWKPLVVYYLLDQPRCFGQLKRLTAGISNKTLSVQLRQLEADGILTRTVQDDPLRSVRYELTARGRALRPIVRALIDWGESAELA